MSSVAGKKVVVTGGTRGIGLATVAEFAIAGAHVTYTGTSDASIAGAHKKHSGDAREDLRRMIDVAPYRQDRTVHGNAGAA